MRVFRTLSIMALLTLTGAPAAWADCICRNRGVEVTEGETACIKTAKGPKLALCEKNLNVTNWKFLGEACPVVMREKPVSGEQEVAAVE